MKFVCEKIIFWLENSRVFSLPMTFMSWLVVFVYALKHHGNIINGLIALVGISAAHLATNLLDDYLDYKILCKDEKFLNSAQKCKCEYIRNGKASLNDLLCVIIFYCSIALITGVFLFFKAGFPVLWLAIVGGIITLLYSKLSLIGLSEAAVGIAFGPLLFEGVYYVMMKNFSTNVLIISIAVVMFTIGLLYTHTLLDFDGDMTAHKNTLCCCIGNKNSALKVLWFIYFIGYFMIGTLAIKTWNYQLFWTYITMPLAVKLYGYMKAYNNDKNDLPPARWYNYPLDNWKILKNQSVAPFYFRLFQARNLMIYFCLILTIVMLS